MNKNFVVIALIFCLLLLVSGCNWFGKVQSEWMVKGNILDSETGNPVSNASITFGQRTLHTDSDGNFELDGLKEAEYTLSVECSGYQPYSQTIIREKTSLVQVHLIPAQPAAHETESPNNGAVSNGEITIILPRHSNSGTISAVLSPFKSVDAETQESSSDIVTIQSVSELQINTNAPDLDIPYELTFEKRDLLPADGTVLAIVNQRGELIPLASLVADQKALYTGDSAEAIVNLDSLEDYIQTSSDPRTMGTKKEDSTQLFRQIILLIKRLTIKWSEINPVVLNWFKTQSDSFNHLDRLNLSSGSRNLLVYVHGLGSESRPAFFDPHSVSLKTFVNSNMYKYIYLSASPTSYNGEKLAKEIQSLANNYDNISIIAHSLGGLVTQEALYYAKQHGYSSFSKIRKVITLGTPHKGVGKTIATIGALNWSSYMYSAADDLINTTKLRSHLTYRNLLEWAVRESMRNQSSYSTLVAGVPSNIKNAKLFINNHISLYTLAGNNKHGLTSLYIDDSVQAGVADFFKNILLEMIYGNDDSDEPAEHDGLVKVESALGQSEARETATVYFNHNDIALANNEAFNWCVRWLQQ